MATNIKTIQQLYDGVQHPASAVRSQGPNGVAKVHLDTLHDIVARASSRVMGDDDTALLVAEGSGGATTAAYLIAYAAGASMLLGAVTQRAAADDQDLLADIDAFDLDGAAYVAIDTNDMDAKFALVEVIENGSRALKAVFGATAATGTAVAPTAYEVGAALLAAGVAGLITSLNTRACLIIGRGTAARGTDAVVITGVDPASDAAHKAERAGMTNPFGVTVTT